jgi:RNase P subunit RPR2
MKGQNPALEMHPSQCDKCKIGTMRFSRRAHDRHRLVSVYVCSHCGVVKKYQYGERIQC